jgi:hypothetical protein
MAQLEVQRLAFVSNPFLVGQAMVVQAQMFTLRQQADRLGTNLVLVQQAMTRQYEAWYGLQTAVERAKDTRTATTVPELNRREGDLITGRARLTAQSPILRASVDMLRVSF